MIINNAPLTYVYPNTIKTYLTPNQLLFGRQLLCYSNTTSAVIRNLTVLSSTTDNPANIPLDEDVLKTFFVFVFKRRFQDVLTKTNIFALLISLQKRSWSRTTYLSWLYVFKTFSILLQDVSKMSWLYAFKTSSRLLQDVFQKRFQDIFNTSSRRLEDLFQKRLQDIFKTSCKNVFKTSSRRLTKMYSRRFQDVSSTQTC